MQYLLFRFDASSSIGLGHAFRCCALIEYLDNNISSYAIQCIVITKLLPEFLKEKVDNLGAQIEMIEESLTLADEITIISAIVKKYSSPVLVLDGYQFNQYYRQQLEKINLDKHNDNQLKVVVFDDTNELRGLYCAMVINALSDADQLGYENSAPKAKLLLGLSFSIIRQEFLSKNSSPYPERKLLLINFGGSDIGSLTLPVIKGVAKKMADNQLDVSAGNIVVITGGGCENIEKIQDFCQKMNFRHIHQCNTMADLLNQTRLAICAPGAIVYELAYCQVPSVFLTIADNQLLSAKAHQKAGWGIVFDGRCNTGVEHALTQSAALWQDQAQLQNMSSIAGELVDGKGVVRIVDTLVDTFFSQGRTEMKRNTEIKQ